MKLILRQAEVVTLTIALDAYLTELAAERGVHKTALVLDAAEGSSVDTADILLRALRDFTLGSANPRVEGHAYTPRSKYCDDDIPADVAFEMDQRAASERRMRRYR